MAPSGHSKPSTVCPLFGEERTSTRQAAMSKSALLVAKKAVFQTYQSAQLTVPVTAEQ